MHMPRAGHTIECDEKARSRLERLSRSRTEEARLVLRTEIVLTCLAGEPLAKRMEICP